MIQQIQSPCDECSGSGEMINAKDRCSNCKGKKVLPEKKLLEVHVDKGMKGGQTIQFSGESDQAPGAQTGDVVIVIEEKPHDRFKRQDTDLITEVEVDLLTALGGGSIAIKHLDDRALLINLVPGEVIKHGTSLICIPAISRFKTGLVLQTMSKSFTVKACHHNGIMNPEIYTLNSPSSSRII